MDATDLERGQCGHCAFDVLGPLDGPCKECLGSNNDSGWVAKGTPAVDEGINPKDAVGIKKAPITTVSSLVMNEVGVGMMEGARKYRRHNYRVSRIKASVYVDATWRHLSSWWEGEDIDPDSGLSHITKAICSLVVMRDAMINDQMADDRPPAADVAAHREYLQGLVETVFEKYPVSLPPHTHIEESTK